MTENEIYNLKCGDKLIWQDADMREYNTVPYKAVFLNVSGNRITVAIAYPNFKEECYKWSVGEFMMGGACNFFLDNSEEV